MTLVTYFILSSILYLSFNFLGPFISINGNEAYLNNFFPGLGVLLLLILIYVIAFELEAAKKVSIKFIIFTALFFNLILLFSKPIASDDLLIYIGNSRIYGIYGSNPYTTPYKVFADDEFYEKIKENPWSEVSTAYGPLFTKMGGLVVKIAGNNFSLNIFLFKTLFVLANLATAIFIYLATKSKSATFLYAWNPLILFEFALNAHVDILMIMLLVAGVYFMSKKPSLKNYMAGFFLILLSSFIKYFTLLLIPLTSAFMYKNLKKPKMKLEFIFCATIIFVGLCVILFFPFWEGFKIFELLFAVVGFQSTQSSPGIFFPYLILKYLNFPDAFKVAKILSISSGIFLITGLHYFVLQKRLLNSFKNTLKYLVIIVFLYLGFLLTWLMPWYVCLLIAVLAIYLGFEKTKIKRNKKGTTRLVVYLVTFWGIFNYLLIFGTYL